VAYRESLLEAFLTASLKEVAARCAVIIRDALILKFQDDTNTKNNLSNGRWPISIVFGIYSSFDAGEAVNYALIKSN